MPDTRAETLVERAERSWRVSRLSAMSRSDRLAGVGFRVDMGQIPLSQEARPSDRCGAHLEHRFRFDPAQTPAGTPEPSGIKERKSCLTVCNQTAVPIGPGDLVYVV